MSTENGHWYGTNGQPHHWVEKKDGSGKRPTTLRDAKLNNWLPSVTTVLKILNRPQLERWKMIQAATAVLTSPRQDGEGLDAFMERVLFKDEEHKEEAAAAADKGTEIHAALEARMTGQPFDAKWAPWIEPAAKAIESRGQYVASEKILVGYGYAGRTDLVQEAPDGFLITDYKSAKTMPDPKKGAWLEHKLQCAFYSAAFERMMAQGQEPRKPIRSANVYISTIVQGSFLICEHDADWRYTYEQGCRPLLTYWSWVTNYKPIQ
jgi:hypothetical protein